MSENSRSLRRFLLVWSGVAVLALCLISAAASFTTDALQKMTERIRIDAEAVAAAGEFGRAILVQRRDAHLWQLTGQREYLDRGMVELSQTDRLIGRLRSTVTSNEEAAIADEVEAAYRNFRVAAAQDEAGSRSVTPFTERLLHAVSRLHDVNVRQMDATNAAASALNDNVDRSALLALMVLPLFVIVVAWRLWSRIVHPMLGLSEAAQSFGAGDLAARAPILTDDEMGEVCRTFNSMAEEIAARERERLDFLATVAHDLRNPLTVIGGTTDLLRRTETSITAQRQGWFDRVLSQARRLEAMTLDLTNAVQVQSGRLILDMDVFDLGELIRETVEDQSQIDQERHAIRCRDDRCVLRGDKARLERVFANLLSNAIKYSDEGTEIAVEMKLEHGEVAVTFADHGVGISPEDLRNLFKPFRRAGGARGVVRGTGLGLFSAKRIVEAHGGRIEIRSELNVGTTVVVRLPR